MSPSETKQVYNDVIVSPLFAPPRYTEVLVVITAVLLILRFICDVYRVRTANTLFQALIITLDVLPYSMIHSVLGLMQLPSKTNDCYQLWAVLLDTFQYSVKASRFSDVFLKKTPLKDLMSSLWTANLLSVRRTKLMVPLWLLWAINSLRIIQGFFASEEASDEHRKEVRFITEYMRHEHEQSELSEASPDQLIGYNYVVIGENKQKFEIKIPEYSLQLNQTHPTKLVTLEKIWQHNGNLLKQTSDSQNMLKDICLSFAFYKLLKRRFYDLPLHEVRIPKTKQLVFEGIFQGKEACNRAFRITELELAFLNDYFNTRMAISFLNGFPVARFLFSVIVIGMCIYLALVVHSYSISVSDNQYIGHGTAVTWCLLVLLMLKELVEIALYASSDWAKVLLLCKYVEGGWWTKGSTIEKAIRRLCNFVIIKRFNRRIRQFNLIHDRFQQFCYYSVRHPQQVQQVRQAVFDSLCSLKDRPLNGYLSKALELLPEGEDKERFFNLEGKLKRDIHAILVWHIATCYCEINLFCEYASLMKRYPSVRTLRTNIFGEKEDLRSYHSIASMLSEYSASLLNRPYKLVPDNNLLCTHVLRVAQQEVRKALRRCYSPDKLSEALKRIADDEQGEMTILKMGAELGKQLTEATRGNDTLLWKILAQYWSGYVLYLAAATKPSVHKIYLLVGGELLTQLWALLSHAGIFGDTEHGQQFLGRDPFIPHQTE